MNQSLLFSLLLLLLHLCLPALASFFTFPGFNVNIWTLTFNLFSLWLCGNAAAHMWKHPETKVKTGHVIWHVVFALVLILRKLFFLFNLKVNIPFDLWYSCHSSSYLCPAVVMVCLLRYAQVVEHSHQCWVNTSALVSGCTNALGLVMVGNFQVNEHTFTMPLIVACSLSWLLLCFRSITPSHSTTWGPAWRSQLGCCSFASSVSSPTGWPWPRSITGWPISGWLWLWVLWCPSSSVSFTNWISVWAHSIGIHKIKSR